VPNFPFPTPPERGALAAAEAALAALGALEGPARALSARGRAMAALPATRACCCRCGALLRLVVSGVPRVHKLGP